MRPLCSSLAALILAFTTNPIAANPISNAQPHPDSLPARSIPLSIPANFSLSSFPLNLSTPNSPNNDSDNYGINCMGSAWGCIGASSNNIMHVLRDYMTLLSKYPTLHYVAGQKIACKEHSVFPFIVGGYYCAFLEGQNVASEGLDGAVLLVKMQQLIEHGCKGCGSVPISDDNDPKKMGKLTVNFVRNSECVGLCLYGKNGYLTEVRFPDDHDPPKMAPAASSGVVADVGKAKSTKTISAAYLPGVTIAVPNK